MELSADCLGPFHEWKGSNATKERSAITILSGTLKQKHTVTVRDRSSASLGPRRVIYGSKGYRILGIPCTICIRRVKATDMRVKAMAA